MVKTDEEQRKITERDNAISFLTSLKQRKVDDIDLLQKQTEVIAKDIETLMKDQPMVQKTVLGAELCSSSVSSSLSSDAPRHKLGKRIF